jgi:gas vesicle protein
MISKQLKEKIKEKIKNKIDYDEMLQNFQTSNAPFKKRQEAIEYLKAQYPEYQEEDTPKIKELLKEIADGQADISDICNS